MALWDGAACMEMDRFLAARGIRFSAPTLGTTLGSPPGPPGHGHTPGSNHYPESWGGPRGSTGQARDYGTYGSDCQAIADALEPYARQGIIVELIWTRRLPRNGTYWKRGVAYTPSFKLAWQHANHVHAAIGVGKHLPNVGPRPTPAPPKPPIPVEEPIVSVFVKGSGGPTVYLWSGLPEDVKLTPVGSEATLAALHLAGYGRTALPGNFGKQITVAGAPVRQVDQSFVDDLT